MWKLILAIPEIVRLIWLVIDLVNKYNKDQQDKRKQDATDKVQEAKTEQEQEDAWDDYFKRGP